MKRRSFISQLVGTAAALTCGVRMATERVVGATAAPRVVKTICCVNPEWVSAPYQIEFLFTKEAVGYLVPSGDMMANPERYRGTPLSVNEDEAVWGREGHFRGLLAKTPDGETGLLIYDPLPVRALSIADANAWRYVHPCITKEVPA
jgi:hypothetical protein